MTAEGFLFLQCLSNCQSPEIPNEIRSEVTSRSSMRYPPSRGEPIRMRGKECFGLNVDGNLTVLIMLPVLEQYERLVHGDEIVSPSDLELWLT